MSITDELLVWWARKFPVMDSELHKEFASIADRIDEKHESVCCEIADKFDGWVMPPKDADGETIHLQDRVRWDNGTFDVHELSVTADGWTTWDDRHGYTVRVDQCHHVHEQTVEDVLEKFVERWMETHHDDIPALKAEYAAKLRLAGEDA